MPSAALPAKPITARPEAERRTFCAPCFTAALPSVTCPSPAIAIAPSRRTASTVVEWKLGAVAANRYLFAHRVSPLFFARLRLAARRASRALLGDARDR